MGRFFLWAVVLAAAGFVAGTVTGYDWRNTIGDKGAVLNQASEQIRSVTGLSAAASARTQVNPAAVAAPASVVASNAAPNAGKAPPASAAVVTVSRPLANEIIEWDEYTARFDAVAAVEIRTRVSGYLNEVAFKDGQDVKQGDLLFVIDARPFERALDQARAEMEQARTKVENTRLDVDRGRPLLERRVMSEKVFDDRANAMRDAQAAVKVAEAKVKTAELDLSFTRVTAPMSGRISRTFVTPGNYVTGGGVNNNTILTTIVSQDPIHVYFDVSENNYIKYKRIAEQGKQAGASVVGAPVYVGLPDEKGFPHVAKLDFIDNRIDASTATLRGRAVLDNKKGLFSPGLFARARIAGSAKYRAILLPDEAIATDQASKFVFVVAEDGTASRKAIVIGPIVDGLRVVREGLGTDDWVVTKGLQRVRAGQKVAVKREPIKLSVADQPGAPSAR